MYLNSWEATWAGWGTVVILLSSQTAPVQSSWFSPVDLKYCSPLCCCPGPCADCRLWSVHSGLHVAVTVFFPYIVALPFILTERRSLAALLRCLSRAAHGFTVDTCVWMSSESNKWAQVIFGTVHCWRELNSKKVLPLTGGLDSFYLCFCSCHFFAFLTSWHITNIVRSCCDSWRNVLGLVWLLGSLWRVWGRDQRPQSLCL